jgi:hypothetical protein
MNIYKIILDNEKDGPNFIKFINFETMQQYITDQLKEYCEVIFSGDKEKI